MNINRLKKEELNLIKSTNKLSNPYKKYPIQKFYESGDVFEGKIFKGLYEGEGRYTWNNGDVFEGKFSKGKKIKGKVKF